MTSNVSAARRGLAWLNTRGHKTAVTVFMIIVVAHWAEHILQAIQIWVLGWSKPEARGVLGIPFPWLVESERMHYGYAIVMLAGFFLLLPGFVGRSRNWWALALGIQFWHHIEHLALLIQALTDSNLAGKPVPTSFIQLIVPRVELHLFYNAVVTLPMIVAMILHRRANSAERAIMECLCAVDVKPKQKVGV